VSAVPPLPEPDEKDWTWVISDPCPDCGFDPRPVRRAEVPELTRRYTALVRAALRRPDADVRPEPAVWAPVEYGCHVRDVCRLFHQRLQLMLTEDDPLFDNWDQDATAVDERYWEQRPAPVAAELAEAADVIADAFGQVRDDQWQRPGRRSNGSVFTVDTFARYFLHDLAHHAWDVTDSAAR
jgi:DinB family protein